MKIDPDIRRFLQAARVAHLGTVDLQGASHVVPVVFILLDGYIYIAIDEKPKTTTRLARIRHIEADPRVTLLVDEYHEDWQRLRWVMCRGSARIMTADTHEIDDPHLREDILRELCIKYPQYRSHDLTRRPLIRVRIERITHWAAPNADPSET